MLPRLAHIDLPFKQLSVKAIAAWIFRLLFSLTVFVPIRVELCFHFVDSAQFDFFLLGDGFGFGCVLRVFQEYAYAAAFAGFSWGRRDRQL